MIPLALSLAQFAIHALFTGGLLFAIALSAYILARYAQRALRGDEESRWLGRHITAVAASHLLLLSWVLARFLVFHSAWSWPWVVALGAVLALSDYSIWQIYRYRRFRERRTVAKEPDHA